MLAPLWLAGLSRRSTSESPVTLLSAARSPPAPAAVRSPPPASTSTPASGAPCTGPAPPSATRIAEIRGNLTARIAEADRQGWPGETEGLKISLAGAQDKLTQIDRRTRTPAPVGPGMPALSRTPATN